MGAVPPKPPSNFRPTKPPMVLAASTAAKRRLALSSSLIGLFLPRCEIEGQRDLVSDRR
jgi:hypothetical protein